MFKSEKYFIGGTLRPHVVKVEVATGVIVWSVAIGTVMIPVLVNGQTQWRKIENALYVPNLHHNLLSVGYLASEGYTTVFPRRSGVVEVWRDDNELFLVGSGFDLFKMYVLEMPSSCDIFSDDSMANVNLAQVHTGAWFIPSRLSSPQIWPRFC